MMLDLTASNHVVEQFILDFEYIFDGKKLEEEEEAPQEWEGEEPEGGEEVEGIVGGGGGGVEGRAVVYVRGVWEFEAELRDEISFVVGTVVGVLTRQGDKEGFWFGEYFVREGEEGAGGEGDSSPVLTDVYRVRRCGWFQCDYVQEITSNFRVIYLYL